MCRDRVRKHTMGCAGNWTPLRLLGVKTEQTDRMIGKEFLDSETLAVTSSFKKCKKCKEERGGSVTGEKTSPA